MGVVGGTFLRIDIRDDPKVLHLNKMKDMVVARTLLRNMLAVYHNHLQDRSWPTMA